MSIHGSAPITYSSTNTRACSRQHSACNKKKTYVGTGYFFPASGESRVTKNDARFYLSASRSGRQNRPDHQRRNARNMADCLGFLPALQRLQAKREGPQGLRMQSSVRLNRASFARHGKPHGQYGFAHVGVAP